MIFWQAFTVSWWSQLGWEAEGSHFFSVEICVWQDSVSFMVVLFHDFKSSRLWMTSPRIQSVEFWSLLWRLGTGWNNKQNTVQMSWKPPWQAGGVGLNLTTANHVIHFDRCWNPAKEAQAGGPQFSVVVLMIMLNAWQNLAEKIPSCLKLAASEATDRAHRIGQHRTVLLGSELKHCDFNCFRHSDPRVIQMMWN